MARKASGIKKSTPIIVGESEILQALKNGDNVGASHVKVTVRGVTRTLQISASIVAEAMSEFNGAFKNTQATA